MENINQEDILVLSTLIAIELSKTKTKNELRIIRSILSHTLCCLSNLC